MFIKNFIRINKENGKEMEELKEKIQQYCLDESKLFEILNNIMNANLDKKRRKRLWIYILNLPVSEKKIVLPPKIINQIEEDSVKDLGRKKYVKDIKWQIWEARQNNNSIIESKK